MIYVIKKRTMVIVIIFTIIYFAIYGYQRVNHVSPKGKYYDFGEKVMYGGVEYQFKGYLYTHNELIKKYKKELGEYDVLVEKDKKYILVEADYERREESTGKEKPIYLFKVLSKYWITGVAPEIEDLIQKKDSISPEALKIGDKSSRYMLYEIVRCNHTDSVWKDFKNATVYIELDEYEGSEYFRKVRIAN